MLVSFGRRPAIAIGVHLVALWCSFFTSLLVVLPDNAAAAGAAGSTTAGRVPAPPAGTQPVAKDLKEQPDLAEQTRLCELYGMNYDNFQETKLVRKIKKKYYDKAALDAGDPEQTVNVPWIPEGHKMVNKKHWTSAIQLFLQAIRHEPFRPDAWQLYGATNAGFAFELMEKMQEREKEMNFKTQRELQMVREKQNLHLPPPAATPGMLSDEDFAAFRTYMRENQLKAMQLLKEALASWDVAFLMDLPTLERENIKAHYWQAFSLLRKMKGNKKAYVAKEKPWESDPGEYFGVDKDNKEQIQNEDHQSPEEGDDERDDTDGPHSKSSSSVKGKKNKKSKKKKKKSSSSSGASSTTTKKSEKRTLRSGAGLEMFEASAKAAVAVSAEADGVSMQEKMTKDDENELNSNVIYDCMLQDEIEEYDDDDTTSKDMKQKNTECNIFQLALSVAWSVKAEYARDQYPSALISDERFVNKTADGTDHRYLGAANFLCGSVDNLAFEFSKKEKKSGMILSARKMRKMLIIFYTCGVLNIKNAFEPELIEWVGKAQKEHIKWKVKNTKNLEKLQSFRGDWNKAISEEGSAEVLFQNMNGDDEDNGTTSPSEGEGGEEHDAAEDDEADGAGASAPSSSSSKPSSKTSTSKKAKPKNKNGKKGAKKSRLLLTQTELHDAAPRSSGRYEVRLPFEKPFICESLIGNKMVLYFISMLLKPKVEIDEFSYVQSEANTPPMHWHQDVDPVYSTQVFASGGEKLFVDPTDGKASMMATVPASNTPQFGVQLPPSSIVMIVPLRNLTYADGPTEFLTGSHVHIAPRHFWSEQIARYRTFIGEESFEDSGAEYSKNGTKLQQMNKTLEEEIEEYKEKMKQNRLPIPPRISFESTVGAVTFMDLRLHHRALANRNKENLPRPILYISYVRDWFKDSVNFKELHSGLFDELGSNVLRKLLMRVETRNYVQSLRDFVATKMNQQDRDDVASPGVSTTCLVGNVTTASAPPVSSGASKSATQGEAAPADLEQLRKQIREEEREKLRSEVTEEVLGNLLGVLRQGLTSTSAGGEPSSTTSTRTAIQYRAPQQDAHNAPARPPPPPKAPQGRAATGASSGATTTADMRTAQTSTQDDNYVQPTSKPFYSMPSISPSTGSYVQAALGLWHESEYAGGAQREDAPEIID
ncbi:unnamed protein product [Amoebophrya sp. A120]|nr:unnamed protein product [Amoebophrya sp. A120]|eukprot:GSA120T00004733001.1